jgi:hypothetical protein
MPAAQNVLAAARAAAKAISCRHQNDGSSELMPASSVPGPGDMAAMLDYVRSHPLRDGQLAGADARDALAILRYLHVWAEGVELAMLGLGHDGGQSWLGLAEARGWHSKQAAQQRFRYLNGRRAALPEDEENEQADHAASEIEAWLAREAEQIIAVSRAVVASVLPIPEAQDSAEVLEAELGSRALSGPSPRELIKWLAIVLGELRFAGSLSALAAPVRAETARLVGEWKARQVS